MGFLTTLSGRWPRELPTERFIEYGKWVDENLTDLNVVKAEELVTTPVVLRETLENFKRESVDIVIMLYGAFTGDDVPCAIADELNVPIILWAPFEPAFDKNQRLYANALVAAVMNAASLKRLGYKNYVIYGSKEDERAVSKIQTTLNAYKAVKEIKGTLLGLFGYRPTAFYNSTFDEALIRKTFGIRFEETDLKMVFDRMQIIDQEIIKSDMKNVSNFLDVRNLPEGHLENHSRLYFALKEIIDEAGYDFATIKCWPEMGKLKTTPCAVMGRLADEGMHIACEGDADAAITMILQNNLTGQPCFMCDMITVDENENLLTYWHCGQAAPSLMNKNHDISINDHPLAGQGTAFYTTLKTGVVTVARFCNIKGKYKLFLLKGEAVDSERITMGAMATVKVKTPVLDIIDTIVKEGIPHHYSIVWDDVADRMKDYCTLLDIEVIEA